MAALETALAAIGGVGAAVATAWLGRKRARGLVRDTDAETLWRELSGELAAVRVDLAAYRSENLALRAELDEANRRAHEAQEEAGRLRRKVDALEAKLARYERQHPTQEG